MLLTREGQRLENCLVVSSFPGRRMSKSKVVVGQAYSLGQRLVCEKP